MKSRYLPEDIKAGAQADPDGRLYAPQAVGRDAVEPPITSRSFAAAVNLPVPTRLAVRPDSGGIVAAGPEGLLERFLASQTDNTRRAYRRDLEHFARGQVGAPSPRGATRQMHDPQMATTPLWVSFRSSLTAVHVPDRGRRSRPPVPVGEAV